MMATPVKGKLNDSTFFHKKYQYKINLVNDWCGPLATKKSHNHPDFEEELPYRRSYETSFQYEAPIYHSDSQCYDRDVFEFKKRMSSYDKFPVSYYDRFLDENGRLNAFKLNDAINNKYQNSCDLYICSKLKSIFGLSLISFLTYYFIRKN